MPQCPLCKSTFATKPEMDRHGCGALVKQSPAARAAAAAAQSASFTEFIATWGWASPIAIALLFYGLGQLSLSPEVMDPLRWGKAAVYVVVLVISLQELRLRVKYGRRPEVMSAAGSAMVTAAMLAIGLFASLGAGPVKESAEAPSVKSP